MSLDEFSALPLHLQRRIDKAFDHACVGPSESESHGGGFIPASPSPDASRIPLSSIPAALQLLDLPPDDEQVLTVFKNAASGWQASSNDVEMDGGTEEDSLYVSRDDWRSVLAVLLEPGGGDEYADSDDAPPRDSYANSNEDEDNDVDPADEYHSPEASDDDSDSDEYMEEPAPSTSRAKRTRRRSSSSSSLSSATPKKLTARQRQTCLDTYALFFPSTSESELPNQRIMIKDIQRLTKLIGDTIKSDELIEMLDEFSTAPDKSMSFDDFGLMMLSAKLA
ncbi:hypothetical protein FB45DRAFT_848483 [Roridomyces roridus]|uniref:EF-hand domain-containing protein n=1 Tax=Roridomyces roridus TaxID=1738132 RepID=A0AAD7F9R2_9AGAR|nr:hypothetical protein FB45DRAFT_848483 [Roridomyces roridus]